MKPARDKEYMAWWHTERYSCVLCERTPVEGHHWDPTHRAMGSKCDDYRLVPLCHDCHVAYHGRGEEELASKFKISVEEMHWTFENAIARALVRFLRYARRT